MSTPLVSVVIPTYGGAEYIGQTIESVLRQTLHDFEVVVVDDASPDHTSLVVNQFSDPRLKYIRHEKNRGSDEARLTGIRLSSAEIIAFLDQDDFFHPEKLETHTKYLAAHADVGLTYNDYFDLNYSMASVREIIRSPRTISLLDLVAGFPIPPSNMVMRREWALREEIWEVGLHGAEVVILGRLWLAGCKFGCVPRALNYRRYHAQRVISNLSGKCAAELECQRIILSDPRCPENVSALGNRVFTNTYLVWANYALEQNETETGQTFLRGALRLDPSILEGIPCRLVTSLLLHSISNDTKDHVEVLGRMFSQLPPELQWLSQQQNTAIARGYLLKAISAVLWDQSDKAQMYIQNARRSRAQIDEPFLQLVTHHLLAYEDEFGADGTHKILRMLIPGFREVAGWKSVRRLKGCYAVNRAFQHYRSGEHTMVLKNVLAALIHRPTYLANRGVVSIGLRSLLSIGL
jgi:glycosyltransferase involved in cell wall biosynthesis